MDVEFGERVLRAGRRIGYEPRSIVYHDIDWSRLTEEYFKNDMNYRDAAERFTSRVACFRVLQTCFGQR